MIKIYFVPKMKFYWKLVWMNCITWKHGDVKIYRWGWWHFSILSRESHEFLVKALNYYKSGVLQERPHYVPKRIIIHRTVRGEIPTGPRVIAKPGEYEAFSNQWGAIHVETPNGKLGIKPREFEVIEWQNREVI